MSLKYGVLSLLVFCLVFFLTLKNYEIWTHPFGLLPEKELVKKSEKKTEIPSMIERQKDPTAIKSYISIAEKNIFNPERKDFPIITSASGTGLPKKPVMRPQVILYGITLTEDYQSATIVNPGRPLKKGERETMTLKVGERIGEYKVAKILSDRITLEAAEDTFEVLLYDPAIPKKRSGVKTEVKPATVTSTLPTPTPTPGSPRVPASVEAPKPVLSKEPVERPKEPVQEGVDLPPLPRPVRPAFPPLRGRSPVSPPPGTPDEPTQ